MLKPQVQLHAQRDQFTAEENSVLQHRVMERVKGVLTSTFESMKQLRQTLAQRGLFSDERNRTRAGSMFLAEALRAVNIRKLAAEEVEVMKAFEYRRPVDAAPRGSRPGSRGASCCVCMCHGGACPQ